MTDQKPALGFVGLGKMGGALAARLAEAGFPLNVFDISEAATAAFLADHTAAAADDLPSLAAAADIVITCLPNGEVVREAVLGEAGLHQGLWFNALLIDMSSSDPRGTAQLGEELKALDCRMLDAPVSGGVPKARQGSLTIMCGGAAEDLEEARPVLAVMGGNILHLGRLGSGQAMKALNNLCSAGGFLIALEVLAAGRQFGLEPETVVDTLNLSTGRNNSTENKIKQYILSGRFDAGFAMDLMVKDIGTALSLARDLGTPTLLSAATVSAWAEALEALGEGADHTELARWIETKLPGQRLE